MSDEELQAETDEDIKARAAWHYYVEGLTQERIAEKLGLGRVKVHRVLAAARDEGIIQFRIRNRIGECVNLQGQLTEQHGLGEAIVVPAAADGRMAPLMIGHAAGEYLTGRINAGDVVGLIEIMKSFNEVKAERAGTFTAYLVSHGEEIAPSQPLALIDG